jgi:hypothetical protein
MFYRHFANQDFGVSMSTAAAELVSIDPRLYLLEFLS